MNKVYLSWDGDGIGRMVGRARLRDDDSEVRRISSGIDSANEMIKNWVISKGGTVTSVGGDEGSVTVPVDALGELPQIRSKYEDLAGATVSIGVGLKMSEADKALLTAKIQGKNRILFYSPECDAALAKLTEKTEYLAGDIAKSNTAMNEGAFTGAKRPVAPAEAESPTATQPEHSQGVAIIDLVHNAQEEAPGSPEQTHAAEDLEDYFHNLASDQHAKDADVHDQAAEQRHQIKSQVAQILQEIKTQAPNLAQLKDAAPDTYKAVMDMSNAMIALARELVEPDKMVKSEEPTVPHSETGWCSVCKDPLDKDGHCKVKAHWKELDVSKDELESSEEDLDKNFGQGVGTGRTELHLPTGFTLSPEGKVKIQHGDGKTGWVSVRSGQIMSHDGHAISSRNPGGK